MKRLRILSVAAFILILGSILFLSVDAVVPTNITPGDTFTYTISNWDVPWEELISPSEAPFDFTDFVFDLSGSTLGVKVMDTYLTGYYMLDFYVVLGKAIVIPFPDNIDSNITDIFGTELTFDEGIGIGLGSLPGSDLVDQIAGTEESFGLPFYLNPNEWSTYENDFFTTDNPELNMTVTNVADSDFEVAISGTTEDGVDIALTATWFRDGVNAGVFKSISGEVDGDINGDDSTNHLGLTLTFEEKQNFPLPSEILGGNDLILSLATADFTHSVTGFSTSLNDQIDDGLVYAADIVTDTEGLDVLKFDVEDVSGCYYDTRIEIYNPETEMLEEVVEELWWNGFTGFPVTEGGDFFSFGDLPYTMWTPTVGLIPLLAPGITPDWDMWKASTLSISQVNEIVEKSLESFLSVEEVTDMGLDLNKLDTYYQLRESGNTMFFYSASEVDLDWNAGQMEGDVEGLLTTTKLSVEVSSNNWLAYTKQGMLAGAGVEIVASISATDIPAEEGTFETGSIMVDINIVLQSDHVSSIPDPEEANPVVGGDATNTGPALTPGFEFIIPLMMITTVILIRKKK